MDLSQDEVKQLAKRSQKESLENKFQRVWHEEFGHLPAPVRQHRFHPTRKFRFDFAWPEWKLAVEIQGSTWQKGGHNTGYGLTADYEKLRLAQRAGWKVLPYGTSDCKDMVAVVTEVAEILCQVPEEL
jgi:very-short-patch-repair endonuclease